MTIPCLNQQHLFMLTMNRNILYLKNNNIPQHDKPVENDIDFSLDLEFLPPAADYGYLKLNYPIHKTRKFRDYVRSRHYIESASKTVHGRTKNVVIAITDNTHNVLVIWLSL